MQTSDTALSASPRIDDSGLRQLFLDARTHNGWLDKPVPDNVLRDL
jgi:3-hydroxypropanoate dehydrogenase